MCASEHPGVSSVSKIFILSLGWLPSSKTCSRTWCSSIIRRVSCTARQCFVTRWILDICYGRCQLHFHFGAIAQQNQCHRVVEGACHFEGFPLRALDYCIRLYLWSQFCRFQPVEFGCRQHLQVSARANVAFIMSANRPHEQKIHKSLKLQKLFSSASMNKSGSEALQQNMIQIGVLGHIVDTLYVQSIKIWMWFSWRCKHSSHSKRASVMLQA